VDVLVFVPHIFGYFTNARFIVPRGEITRQIEIGRSITAGLQVGETV
jgi:hypothetical protein